jgi:hypothetical protein
VTVLGDTAEMSPRVSARVGALVVRAWVEPGAGARDVRARVLAISGPGSEMQEVGAAVGIDGILALVAEGLRQILPTDEDESAR